jgi:poly(A) polymerase
MKVTGNWHRAAPLQAVLAALVAGGHRALAVGGCVRNDILGLPVADIDIATDARPDQVIAIAIKAGFHTAPTGIEHGTVTVIAEGVPHEVTTFRRDTHTDGRRAKVAFGIDLSEDAARRDFTMNALYADAAGEVIDPLGGLPDLLARRVRFVGDPAERIREDYLRILRFFRFQAAYGDPGGGIDPDGLAACSAHAEGIERLSRERIGQEMRKLLAAPDPGSALAAMQATGVLGRVLPGADAASVPRLVHAEAGEAPDWLARLAALGANGEAKALRLSRNEEKRLAVLKNGLSSASGPAELGYRFGTSDGAAILRLRTALSGADLPSGADTELTRGAEARLPVTAADLMPGLSGEALGRRLREIEARWIASGFTLGRDELLA